MKRAVADVPKFGWKWRHFIPVWFVVFWTIPSYKIHNMLMTQTPPPGSNLPPPPAFEPFGAVYFLKMTWDQASWGDIGDAFSIILLQMLPFIAYTLVVAAAAYGGFLVILSVFRDGLINNGLEPVRMKIKLMLTRWNISKIGSLLMLFGVLMLAYGGVCENFEPIILGAFLGAIGIIITFSIWYLKTLRT